MISTLSTSPHTNGMNRTVVIAASVLVLHVAALWALQTGLLRRAVEVIVPAEVLSEFLAPPPSKAEAPPAQPVPPEPQMRRPPRPTVAPREVTPPRAPNLPTVAPEPVSAAATNAATPPQPAAAAPAPPAAAPATAPARVELPSSDADYLNNPRPPYPPMSKRLGEQGKVVVRVLIGADGRAQQAEVRTTSGYDRLDQAAVDTVLRWRYVPGKRNGLPEAMWFNVPIHFVLE